MVTVDAPTVLIVRGNLTDSAEVAVLRLAFVPEQGICVASLFICHRAARTGEQYPAVIRYRTHHKFVRFLAPRFRVSERAGTKQNERPWHFHQWAIGIDPNISRGSGLTGSPRAYVVSRFISAVAGFWYWRKRKMAFLPRDGAAPVLFCMAIPLYERTGKYGFSPPPAKQRLKPSAVGLAGCS